MRVLNIILILPDGAKRHVGEIKRSAQDEPWDATLYTSLFESYLVDSYVVEMLEAQNAARVLLEFRQV